MKEKIKYYLLSLPLGFWIGFAISSNIWKNQWFRESSISDVYVKTGEKTYEQISLRNDLSDIENVYFLNHSASEYPILQYTLIVSIICLAIHSILSFKKNSKLKKTLNNTVEKDAN